MTTIRVKCVISLQLVAQNRLAKIKTFFKQVSQTLPLAGQQLTPSQTRTIGWISVFMVLKKTEQFTFWPNQLTHDFKLSLHIN